MNPIDTLNSMHTLDNYVLGPLDTLEPLDELHTLDPSELIQWIHFIHHIQWI